MAVLGLDPFRYLYSRDTDERILMIELSNEMIEVKKIMDHNLAVDIANMVGRLFKT